MFYADVSSHSALQQGFRVKASLWSPGRAVLGFLHRDQYSQHVLHWHPLSPSCHTFLPLDNEKSLRKISCNLHKGIICHCAMQLLWLMCFFDLFVNDAIFLILSFACVANVFVCPILLHPDFVVIILCAYNYICIWKTFHQDKGEPPPHNNTRH